MANKSSRRLVLNIQSTAEKAKGLFSKAISEKRLKSSNRLQNRLQRRSRSEPSNKTNIFDGDFDDQIANLGREFDNELKKFNRGNSYQSFDKKLQELEREAHLEIYQFSSDSRCSSDSSSDSDESLDSLDAVKIGGRSWRSSNVEPRKKKHFSTLGRSAYVALFSAKASAGARKRKQKS